jgi:hypothetical protein
MTVGTKRTDSSRRSLARAARARDATGRVLRRGFDSARRGSARAKEIIDAFSLGPTADDLAEFEARREAASEARSRRLARAHTRAELEQMLEAERERMPDLLDAGSSQEVSECVDLTGDLMKALELQAGWGLD